MEIKKLSDLIADFEKSLDETKRELNEIKATMIGNWSGKVDISPKLLDGSEKTALQMFMKIIEYYYLPREGQKTESSDKPSIENEAVLGSVDWIPRDKYWTDYPIGTKAKAIGGGYWLKTSKGWSWNGSGSSFPTPGGDNSGEVLIP